MMKRMNYIRNTLDQHDPQELTSKVRQDASKKRDERIFELWRKDQEQPKVSELVAKLKEDSLKRPKQFFNTEEIMDAATDEQLIKANELAENSIFSTNQGSGHNPAVDSHTRHSIMTGQETILANQTTRNFKAGHSLVVPNNKKLLQTTNSGWQ